MTILGRFFVLAGLIIGSFTPALAEYVVYKTTTNMVTRKPDFDGNWSLQVRVS